MCSFTGERKSSLVRHVRVVHDKEKPYSCPSCPYMTGDAGALRRHIKAIHDREKPFKCPSKECNFETGW